MRTLYIEFERDRVSWFRRYISLGDAADRKLKTIFLISGIFPGKADHVILLRFEYTINPENLIKIVGAVFKKNNFFIFFSHMNYPSF